MPHLSRRKLLGATLTALPLMAVRPMSAFAQSPFPASPVNIVVGTEVGGGLDTLARVYGPKMTRYLNDQQTVVLNRPGGGQMIGLSYVKAQPANGYHIAMISGSSMIGTLMQDTGIDILNEFTPVGNVAVANLAIVANKTRNFTDAQALVDGIVKAAAEGSKLRYAHTGFGSITHVAMESWLLKNDLSDAVQGVPFDGSSPARTALLGDQVAFGVVGIHHYIANKDSLDAIGIMNNERDQLDPDVPALSESPFPYVNMPAPYMFVARAGTPDDVIERLAEAVKQASGDEDVVKALAANDLNLVYKSPAETKAYMQGLMSEWAPVAEAVRTKL